MFKKIIILGLLAILIANFPLGKISNYSFTGDTIFEEASTLQVSTNSFNGIDDKIFEFNSSEQILKINIKNLKHKSIKFFNDLNRSVENFFYKLKLKTYE